LRYALGILYGALLPGIIFMVSAFIKLMGDGETDPDVLAAIWDIFMIWVVMSVVILIAPLLILYIVRRSILKEAFLFEIGGLSLFTPFWFALATELSGDSWLQVLLAGVEGLPFLGPGGSIIGGRVDSVLLIPTFIMLPLLGVLILRPSFIRRKTSAAGPTKPVPAEPKPDTEGESIEVEMPGVAAPVADEKSMTKLRNLLIEIGAPDGIIKGIIGAGIATVEDLVGTGPDQLATMIGADKKTADALLMAAQKKVWFGGI